MLTVWQIIYSGSSCVATVTEFCRHRKFQKHISLRIQQTYCLAVHAVTPHIYFSFVQIKYWIHCSWHLVFRAALCLLRVKKKSAKTFEMQLLFRYDAEYSKITRPCVCVCVNVDGIDRLLWNFDAKCQHENQRHCPPDSAPSVLAINDRTDSRIPCTHLTAHCYSSSVQQDRKKNTPFYQFTH